MISQRKKVALAAAKARGVKLGNPANLRNQLDGSAKGNAAKAARAYKRAADLLPVIAPLKAGGASLRQIADRLTRRGIPAPWGHLERRGHQARTGRAGATNGSLRVNFP
jgi:hypothetical protein